MIQMSPVSMHDGEVQHYASSILVKGQQYFATLTNERLIIEGPTSREFKTTSIIAAYPIPLQDREPAVKIIFATPAGQKEMIWTFPCSEQFREGERDAWVDNITNIVGENPLAVPAETTDEQTRTDISKDIVIETEAEKPKPSEIITIIESKPEEKPAGEPDLIPGETITISTAGVRVKHTFFTIYLTNLRLILQNNAGKIGREFAISDLKDAAELESESGEPEIALSVGMQSGLRQMILSFPTKPARDAWMSELQAKLPAHRPAPKQEEPAAPERVGTFVPATNEKTLVTTPNVRIKNRLSVIHLTNTRFVVDSASGLVGEFALNTLNRAVRMASEIGEPGIALKIGSSMGEKEMHIIFSSVNDRESWIDALTEVIPDRAITTPETREYSVTTVTPQKPVHTQQISCPSCHAMNHAADEYCSFCGAELHPMPVEERPQRQQKRAKPEKVRAERPPRMPKPKAPYNGSIMGFITRPTDAFSYYCRDGVKQALPFFLISGAVWSVITVLFLAFIIPLLLKLDKATFPIITSLSGNPLLLIILILMLFVLWAVGVLLHAVISGGLAALIEPGASFSECMGVVMRSSMTFAVCGWIPILGMFAASIWAAVCAWKGIASSQDMGQGAAAAASFVGLAIVYAVLVCIGVI
ncbi:MAG TPA: Yip1 family protein [Methanocorpusculum sp.]|nr:Yip1 family protein [Methanocorpusculum sp.]